jgi:hypothetical protein
VSDEELDPYSVLMLIVHGIVRRFVRRFGHKYRELSCGKVSAEIYNKWFFFICP